MTQAPRNPATLASLHYTITGVESKKVLLTFFHRNWLQLPGLPFCPSIDVLENLIAAEPGEVVQVEIGRAENDARPQVPDIELPGLAIRALGRAGQVLRIGTILTNQSSAIYRIKALGPSGAVLEHTSAWTRGEPLRIEIRVLEKRGDLEYRQNLICSDLLSPIPVPGPDSPVATLAVSS